MKPWFTKVYVFVGLVASTWFFACGDDSLVRECREAEKECNEAKNHKDDLVVARVDANSNEIAASGKASQAIQRGDDPAKSGAAYQEARTKHWALIKAYEAEQKADKDAFQKCTNSAYLCGKAAAQ